jgi:type 1 glutamine amidotransferase/cytochrome c2
MEKSKERGMVAGVGRYSAWLLIVVGMGWTSLGWGGDAAAAPKRILIIAGKKSHGPEGNGIHDYLWSARLIKVMLENSSAADQVEVEVARDGWPEKQESIEQADSIMIISDGRDGDLYEEAPHLSSPERIELISKQVRRGCGLVTFHFSTFAPDRYAEQILDWVGGYFDWENEGKRDWYSAIQVADTAVELATPTHAVSRGVKPFKMKEEFYFNLRFHPVVGGMVPLLRVPSLPGRDESGKVVAWARERPQGGRGFGTTCGHFYENWRQEEFRRLILNGLVWSTGLDVPATGVQARFFERGEIDQALEGKRGAAPSSLDKRPIRVLMIAGNEAHEWHNWKKTTPAIQALLEKDPRVRVDVRNEIETLGKVDLAEYQAVLLNYCNWQDPKRLSETSQRAFVDYLQKGGGLVVVHFANGAFHFSLPGAGESDWPEYRRMVRRVWDHQGKGESQSGHDAFGLFEVKPTSVPHPVTAGLGPFTVTDELYFRQAGEERIEPLLVARSKVTDRDEPLAFAYRYGQGRVFQTLLGHSEKTYDSFEAREILRRSIAWVADRPVISRPIEADPNVVVDLPPKGEMLAEGRFGKSLDLRVMSGMVSQFPEGAAEEVSVSMWARMASAKGYNILLARLPKSSPEHWEIFTEPGTGELILYAPGMVPDHVRSGVSITDGRWHHLSVFLSNGALRWVVDGKGAGQSPVQNGPGLNGHGGLSVGSLVEGGLGCDGWIDELQWRKEKGVVEKLPTEPANVDSSTMALWRFDSITAESTIVDESPRKLAMTLRDPTKVAAVDRAVEDPHFLEGSVGFHWREKDSMDDRWNQADIGPMLASVLPVPSGGLIARGLSIQLDTHQPMSVAYDLQTMSVVAGWWGGFLHFDPTRHGLISPPRIQGKIAFGFRPQTRGAGEIHSLRGIYRRGSQVIIESAVGGSAERADPSVRLREMMDGAWFDDRPAFIRTMEIASSDRPVRISIAVGDEAKCEEGGRTARAGGCRFGVAGAGRLTAEGSPPDSLWLEVPAGRDARTVQVVWGDVGWSDEQFSRLLKNLKAPSISSLVESPQALWTKEVTTTINAGSESAAYVVDDLPLPTSNPYRALCFPSDHAFLPNGDLVVSMVHGDVWIGRGVGQTSGTIRWRRFAGGLHQPLGLTVKEGEVFVLGRDQITRLVDRNHDGEADFYENYFNKYEASIGGHDYVTCLEADSEGRLLFLSAKEGLVRVRSDRSGIDILARGFRNPNGMGIRPKSLGAEEWITVAPQEGNWTPSSSINRVRVGGFYGFRSGDPAEKVPESIDRPLCWIPRLLDNSSGSQLWVDSGRFGPLDKRMLHFSYGQCRALVGLSEQVGSIWQGGVVTLPWEFRSGVMRGEVNPADGQVYVSGLKGWVSSAVDDGCLCRVRYTGRPFVYPMGVETFTNGLLIRFSGPVDEQSAGDSDRYRAFAWNYKYGPQYGSPEIDPRDPSKEGKAEWNIASATVQEGGRAIFLEIPSLTPVMQLTIQMKIESADRQPINTMMAYTIHAIADRTMPGESIVRRARPGDLPKEIESRLDRGVVWKVASNGGGGGRGFASRRSLGFFVPKSTTMAEGIAPGPFRARASGYLRAEESASYQLRLEGEGRVKLSFHDDAPIEIPDLGRSTTARVSLHRGYNRYRLEYESTLSKESRLRVLWSSDSFAEEPIPASLFFFDGELEEIVSARKRERGEKLVREHRCWNCHAGDAAVPVVDGPDLIGIGSRVNAAWMAKWLTNPRQHRAKATMPTFFDETSGEDRQTIADVVAYLSSLRAQPSTPRAEALSASGGEELFEDLNCIACHTVEPTDSLGHGRISLAGIGEKFSPEAMSAFLREPAAHYQGTAMPQFHLTDEEVGRLTAFLAKQPSERPGEEVALTGDAKRGSQSFSRLGCQQCHRVDVHDVVHSWPAKKLGLDTNWSGGCLAESRSKGSVGFAFSSEEREAVAAYLLSRRGNDHRRSLMGESRYQFEHLRCGSCHSRDGQASPRNEIVLQESSRGLPPEPIPDLTWGGEKLRPSYVTALLRGEAGTRARPWLKGRMPSFAGHADAFARGWAAEFGHDGADDAPAAVDSAMVSVGDQLTGLATGLDCRQCHAIGSQEPVGDDRTQLALGINFSLIKDRLRHEHYLRFVLDPPRYDLSTRMPKLSLDGRTTKRKDLLGGDARRQFEAIWQFIQSLPPVER